MSFLKSTVVAATIGLISTLPAMAEGMRVDDPFARVSSKMSKSGAAFMVIHNETGADDRLIGAKSEVAKRVELHTHKENADGMMQMLHIKEGFAVAKGGVIEMKRGGKHVMFMGLTRQLSHGDKVAVTLIFEKAGEVAVEMPVDLKRKPGHGAHGMGHGGHGNHDHSHDHKHEHKHSH